jgi:hypothetical protein
MRPRRPAGANLSPREKVDSAEHRGKNPEDDARQQQPGGKFRPHEIGGLPIGNVGDERQREADDGKWHEHDVNRMPGDGGGGLGVRVNRSRLGVRVNHCSLDANRSLDYRVLRNSASLVPK